METLAIVWYAYGFSGNVILLGMLLYYIRKHNLNLKQETSERDEIKLKSKSITIKIAAAIFISEIGGILFAYVHLVLKGTDERTIILFSVLRAFAIICLSFYAIMASLIFEELMALQLNRPTRLSNLMGTITKNSVSTSRYVKSVIRTEIKPSIQ